MRFAITGSTGFLGSALTRGLRATGHDVIRIVRRFGALPPHERAVIWHPDQGTIEAAGLDGTDVIIHLAGESLAGIWTPKKKWRIRESRIRGTTLIAQTTAALDPPPLALFSASAMGFYGDRPGEVLDEDSPAGMGYLADVVRAWEAATAPAEQAGIRTVHMRFGNILHADGGLIKPLLPLFKLGLGARFGSGEQYWPWIARDEVLPAILHVLEHPELHGPVNFMAPRPATNADLTDAIAAAVHRRAPFAIPAPLLRLAPGGMGDDMLLAGARVVPRRLLDSGYEFRCPELTGDCMGAGAGA